MAEFASMRISKTERGRKRLFNREERLAIEVVNERWEAVAAALLTHGTLGGADVPRTMHQMTWSV
jgi:hypothetical protein